MMNCFFELKVLQNISLTSHIHTEMSCALPQVCIQHDNTSVIYKYTERKVCPSITEGTAGCGTH